MTSPLIKVDDRGRVTIARPLKSAGIEPSPYYVMDVAASGVITLTPATITTKEPA
jgi:hypothetical protein